jgi:hypothetical protein
MQRVERKEDPERPTQSEQVTSIEEELRTLNSLAPELVEVLPRLFKKAVVDSIKSGMGGKDFGLVLDSLPGIGPEHRPLVFRFLDSLYGEKAGELERAIDRRFQSEVRQLLRKMKINEAVGHKLIDKSIRSR